jgi:hypothetical protein
MRDNSRMRASDLERLREPYDESTNVATRSPMAALGVEMPGWKQLESLILADLTEQFPFGIGWWAPHPGTKRRILISDQLYACTASVSVNMVEAGLHWLEFLDYTEREGARFADAVKIQDGYPVVDPPPCDSPLQDLGPSLVKIHAVGMIRALAGALDCLAGTIIGALALPKDILRADFTGVRIALQKTRNATTAGGKWQAEFENSLENHIRAAGPDGWLEWLLGFRNMLIHRGRRLEMGQYLPRNTVL